MQQKTKRDLAYEEIKKLILSGKLSNDMSISENVLAKMLTEQDPVRDALRRLEMDGFVRIIPNQGVVIREVSINEVKRNIHAHSFGRIRDKRARRHAF